MNLYIGPGLGGGAIVAILAILSSFGISILAILWYPFKKIYQKFIKKKKAQNEEE